MTAPTDPNLHAQIAGIIRETGPIYGIPEEAASAILSLIDGWLPIESAPNDTIVLLFGDRNDRFACGYTEYGRDGWFTPAPCSFESDSLKPTHWRPLPPPPEGS